MSPPAPPTLTTLAPLHSDIVSLIFDFFVDTIPLHSRQFQDLLILSRDIYAANAARLYEDVVLDEKNSRGFFFSEDGRDESREKDIRATNTTFYPTYTFYHPSLSLRKYDLIQHTKRLTLKHGDALRAISEAEFACPQDESKNRTAYLFTEAGILVFHQSFMSSMCNGTAEDWDDVIASVGSSVFSQNLDVCITFADEDLPWVLGVSFEMLLERFSGFRSLTYHNSRAVPDFQLTCQGARIHVFLKKLSDDDEEGDAVGEEEDSIVEQVEWLFQGHEDQEPIEG
ncbi:hypothetical protein IAT38_006906 [Cryptococcus sp. DSM 104549]